MLRMTLILCAAMFVALLIGGEDRGQARPGLMGAYDDPVVQPPVVAQREPAAVVTQAAFTPATEMPEAVQTPTSDLTLPLVQPEAVQAALTEAETPVAEEPAADVWYVAADTVNVREGPGKNYPVLDKLAQGDAVAVVWQDDTGWAKIRIEGDGIEGFVSTDFLTQTAP